jgi:hypothetical protein
MSMEISHSAESQFGWWRSILNHVEEQSHAPSSPSSYRAGVVSAVSALPIEEKIPRQRTIQCCTHSCCGALTGHWLYSSLVRSVERQTELVPFISL